jgi:hypothetical protein
MLSNWMLHKDYLWYIYCCVRRFISWLYSLCLSVYLPVRPSVRMEELGSHWTAFMKFDIWVLLDSLSRKFKFLFFNIWEKTHAVGEGVCKFITTSRWSFLRMRNVSDIGCTKKQSTNFTFNNSPSPPKVNRLWDNVEKMLDSKTSHIWQKGAFAFHAG